jgi:hypothetical protein
LSRGVLVAALVPYPRLRAGLQALLAFCLWVLIATAGAMHLAHVVIDEVKWSDFTGDRLGKECHDPPGGGSEKPE